MNMIKLILVASVSMLLVACGGGGDSANVPGVPSNVSVAPDTTGTAASVSFTAPASDGGRTIHYLVTANPGNITTQGKASPIVVTGLDPQTAYTYTVIASNTVGNSAPVSTGVLNFYSIVETFHEPMTQPNDTIFTGTFTYDSTHHAVSNLTGSLTQSMTKPDPLCVGMMCFGPPMTEVSLGHQLSSATATLGGVDGLLVTTFAINSTDVFNGGGFTPGGVTEYFDLNTTTPNNNAYAMIFVNIADPELPLEQAQIDKLAYADCTPGGLMMATCMTGTTVTGYGAVGTMSGYPVTQVITKLGVPGTPTSVSVASADTTGTAASVSFTAPASSGSSAITSYTVTANPGNITATGTDSPIVVTGLTPQTAYTYTVTATNSLGNSVPVSTGTLNFYNIVETFHEPMTQPNDTIFTGTFTYDSTHHAVSNLTGSLTQSMTKPDPLCVGMMCFGPPMTEVSLGHQLSSATATLGGVDGLLVTTFAINSTDVFNGGGFTPGGVTEYFDLSTTTPNNNAYAMIFVNLADPTTALAQEQIDKLAYADCTPGGLMMATCMTGTTVAGYGAVGTMSGYPVTQVITKQ